MPPPTPHLLIDAEIAERNHQRLLDYLREHGLCLRAHTKTHKIKKLGELQAGPMSVGLTVAKVGEADVMATVCDDLLLAYPIVDNARAERVAALANQVNIRVAVDSKLAIQTLSDAAGARAVPPEIGILVDMDVGYGRTGVQTPADSLELAQFVDATQHVRLDGLFIYPGHVRGTLDEQTTTLTVVDAKVQQATGLWLEHGLEPAIVSSGSTPSAYHSHLVRAVTEIRPGTYIYNDMNTVRGGYCTIGDCAARLVCTVVSNAVPGQVVIDAGSKTLTMDPSIDGPNAGFGAIVEYPEARIARLSEEHGQVDITNCPNAPQLGERVHVIPNHICPCSNLQNEVWWLDRTVNDEPQRIPVDARGALV